MPGRRDKLANYPGAYDDLRRWFAEALAQDMCWERAAQDAADKIVEKYHPDGGYKRQSASQWCKKRRRDIEQLAEDLKQLHTTSICPLCRQSVKPDAA